MPLNFPAPKSLVSDLSFEVLFVSGLAMVLSEYWKKLEALSGGLHAHLPQKDNDQKVNLTEESQEAKKKIINLANLILILWGKSGVKEFEFENKNFSFCQT